jgi:hypothetical protein
MACPGFLLQAALASWRSDYSMATQEEDVQVFRKAGEKFPLRLNQNYERILNLVQRYADTR